MALGKSVHTTHHGVFVPINKAPGVLTELQYACSWLDTRGARSGRAVAAPSFQGAEGCLFTVFGPPLHHRGQVATASVSRVRNVYRFWFVAVFSPNTDPREGRSTLTQKFSRPRVATDFIRAV